MSIEHLLDKLPDSVGITSSDYCPGNSGSRLCRVKKFVHFKSKHEGGFYSVLQSEKAIISAYRLV